MSSLDRSGTLDTLAGASVEEATSLTGEVIGGILEVGPLLGKGGMGVVYQVFHREWNRQLAMKVPLALGDVKGFDLKRWVREAHTWIDLGLHPRVVSCWFVRQWKGVPVLFLDLFSGGSLKERLEKRKAPPQTAQEWGQALTWLIHACEGLHHAHQMGLVHRDIKPANLLFDSEDTLAVTDFGLGKAIDKASESMKGQSLEQLKESTQLSTKSSLTRTGVMSGTPHYAPPEQWMQKQVGPEADIYALAIVAYEILTGRHPFEPPGERWTLGQLISAHLMAKPEPPHTFHPDVPVKLSETLARCLGKRAADRTHSLAELRDVLIDAFKERTGRDYAFGFPQPLSQRADALNNKAVSLWSIGLREEALQAWAEADRLERNHLEVTYNRMVTSWLTGRRTAQEAESSIRDLASISVRGRSSAGLFMLARGRYPEAASLLQESLASAALSEEGTLWRGLGEAQMALGESGRARESFERALQLIPTDLQSSQALKRIERESAGPREGVLARTSWKARGSLTAWLLTEDSGALLLLFGRKLVVLDRRGEQRAAVEIPVSSSAPLLKEKEGRVLVLDGQQSWGMALVQGPEWKLVEFRPWQERVVGFVDAEAVLVGDTTLQLKSRLDQKPLGPLLVGHEKQVLCHQVLDGGKRLVTGGADRVVRLWSLRDGGCAAEGKGHQNFIDCMALGSQGQLLVSGDRSGNVFLWHLPKMEKLHRFEFAGPVVNLVLKGDGKEQTLFVVYRPEDDEVRTAVVFLDRLQVVFERPGRYFYWGPGFGIWDSHGFKLFSLPEGVEWRSRSERSQLLDAHYQPGRNELFLWTEEAELLLHLLPSELPEPPALTLVRANTLSEVQKARQQFAHLMEAAWASYRAEDWSDSYWQLSRARLVEGYSREPETLELLSRLAKRLCRQELREIWRVRELVSPGGDQANRIALDHRGAWAATSSGQVIRLWDLKNGTCIRGLTGHRDEVIHLQFWEEGLGYGGAPLLLSFGADRTVRVWNPNSGECLQQLVAAEHPIVCAAVSRYSRHFAFVTRGGQLSVGQWQATEPFDLEVLASYEYDGIPHQLRISADGKYLVVMEDKGRSFVFSEGYQSLKSHLEFPYQLGSFLGRSHRFLGAHPAGRLETFGLDRRKTVATMAREAIKITSVTCPADGSAVATLDARDTLRLWLLDSGRCVLERPQPERLKRLLFSGNGRYLAGLSETGGLLVWELEWQLDPDRPREDDVVEEPERNGSFWQRLKRKVWGGR